VRGGRGDFKGGFRGAVPGRWLAGEVDIMANSRRSGQGGGAVEEGDDRWGPPIGQREKKRKEQQARRGAAGCLLGYCPGLAHKAALLFCVC
jgi:hypothetical protein